MEGKIKYKFTAQMWKHNPPGAWYFISLPKHISQEIRENLKWQEEGWGRMKVNAQIAETIWETAIWFDTKRETYLLPIKAEIRKQCKLNTDENIEITLWL